MPFGLAIAEDDGAAFILHGIEQHLDFLARLRRHDLVQPFVVPFFELDDALALVADVDDDVVADDVEDAALDDFVGLEFLLLHR